MNSEMILVFGYKGRLQRAGTYQEILAEDEATKNNGSHYPLITHHAEMTFLNEPVILPTHSMDSNYKMLMSELQSVYQRFGRYGDFGDVLFVVKANGLNILTGIGRKAYRLPALAADLVPIVIDSNNRKFFLGVIRGDNGKRATVGGFMDVKDCELESAVECLTHEAFEEIGLTVRLKQSVEHGIKISPFPQSAEVQFTLLGETHDALMSQLGIFYSPSANLRPEFKTKRVHAAAAYVLPIHLNQTVTVEQLRSALIPQDKVENNQTFVWDMSELDPGLGSGHQHMYDLAKEFISNGKHI